MFEGCTARIIATIFISLIIIGAIIAIWNAIPGIIKLIAIIAGVIGIYNIFMKK